MDLSENMPKGWLFGHILESWSETGIFFTTRPKVSLDI